MNRNMPSPSSLNTQRCSFLRHDAGFTLIEMVMVIVLMGVVGSMVAVFMKTPVDSYFDSARRAAMADEADTTLRRMAREIRGALPNSLRQTNTSCIEFIPVKATARYRAENAAVGGLPLTFPGVGNFDMLGLNANLSAEQRIALGDVVVIHNLGATGGSDAYSTTDGVRNWGTVTTGGVLQGNTNAVGGSDIATPTNNNAVTLKPQETRIPMTWPSAPPLESPSKRFFVVPGGEQMVAFLCSGESPNITLQRIGYTSLQNPAAQCKTASLTAGTAIATTLATGVSACTFDFVAVDLQRNGLVQINLSLTQANETVTLYQEVHVNNSP